MSNQYGPRIVTDGLVLCLDAANRKSYPGTGTTWSDLSESNVNGSVAGPVYTSDNSGAFIFDGVNDYGFIPDVDGVTEFTLSNNYSIDFWCYMNAVQNDTRYQENHVVEKWSGSGGYPYTFRYYRNSLIMGLAVYNGSAAQGVNIAVSHSNWWHICGVLHRSSSAMHLYGNGGDVYSTSAFTLTGTITNTSGLFLMKRGNNLGYGTGRLACLKIYNRALTANEVRQNYNATKGRFGL